MKKTFSGEGVLGALWQPYLLEPCGKLTHAFYQTVGGSASSQVRVRERVVPKQSILRVRTPVDQSNCPATSIFSPLCCTRTHSFCWLPVWHFTRWFSVSSISVYLAYSFTYLCWSLLIHRIALINAYFFSARGTAYL